MGEDFEVIRHFLSATNCDTFTDTYGCDKYGDFIKIFVDAAGNVSYGHEKEKPKQIDAFNACSLIDAMQKILSSNNIDECHSIAKEVLSNFR